MLCLKNLCTLKSPWKALWLKLQCNTLMLILKNTVIRLDADENSAVIASGVEEGLPIQVTGVTSNGYFRINLGGETFYIQGIGLTAPEQDNLAAANNKQIYDILVAQKAVFPEGMKWTMMITADGMAEPIQEVLAVQDLHLPSVMQHLEM